MSKRILIKKLRREYLKGSLMEKDVAHNPQDQFHRWFLDAIESEPAHAHAFTLATVSKSGEPSARILLLKHYGRNGFEFCGHYESQKGRDLSKNTNAAMVFHWGSLERQIRIEGKVVKCSAKESDRLFAERPRDAQIATFISQQSQVVESRALLEDLFLLCQEQFEGKKIPRPKNWGGFSLIPTYFEFWQGRANRLNDRLAYSKSRKGWKIVRLAP